MMDKTVLCGTVKRIRHRNDRFAIGVLQHDESQTEVAFIGDYPAVEGTHIELRGKMVMDPKWGMQFRVDGGKMYQPQNEDQMIDYLANAPISGVGRSTAEAIVNTFGMQTKQVLESKDKRLLTVRGIGKATAQKIWKSIEKFSFDPELGKLLSDMGYGAKTKNRVYKKKWTKEMIRSNPYIMLQLAGIGFKRADTGAKAIGFALHHPIRIQQAILFTLDASREGHTYLPPELMEAQLAPLLGFEPSMEEVEDGLKALLSDKKIVSRHEGYYSAGVYFAELGIANGLVELQNTPPTWTREDVERVLHKYHEDHKMHLTRKQQLAVLHAGLNNVLVLTGEPGSGKSTTVDAVLSLFREKEIHYSLCAPTGRAAKRMEEITGEKSRTIHRLLGVTGDGHFSCNAEHPLETQAVIVDEVSMCDVYLMHALIRALKPETKLVLVGDPHQLPSVGPGNVLKDIIASNKIYTVHLDTIHRQAQQSMIITNASRINAGQTTLTSGKSTRDDFFISGNVSPEGVAELLKTRIPTQFGIDPRDIQVLTPIRKRSGDLNMRSLNDAIQRALNPNGQRYHYDGDTDFRLGDRVMQLRNNYEKNVFNGEIGYIDSVQDKHITVHFPDLNNHVLYQNREVDQLELSYATTIHKSQGSEFKAVIVVLPHGRFVESMLKRNLLYTAVTRAIDLCLLVSRPREISKAIKDNSTLQRLTGLKLRLLDKG